VGTRFAGEETAIDPKSAGRPPPPFFKIYINGPKNCDFNNNAFLLFICPSD